MYFFLSRNPPFDKKLISRAETELDYLARPLESEGVRVYRPPAGINRLDIDGYTSAMSRDVLMSVRNTLIEACLSGHPTEFCRDYLHCDSSFVIRTTANPYFKLEI